MAGTVTHLAIADKIYDILGSEVIKNYSLFLGGNIAPDAIHAKKDYQRADKKRSHLCDGIRSYGYGYPEIAKLFKDRVDEFINKYYMTAGEDKDLYLGYIVHLLADELYLLSTYEQIETRLRKDGRNLDEPDFRKNLADEVNAGSHREFFSDAAYINDVSVYEYNFKADVLSALEAVWDYEIKDYINADEMNISKRWVIDTFVKSVKIEPTEATQDDINNNRDKDKVIKFIDFIDLTAEKIIEKIQYIL
jgi:hypothetical protein